MRAVAAILLAFVAFGCDGNKRRETPSVSAPKTESREAEEVAVSNPAPPLFERHAAEPAPPIDPSQVPVEEDFITEAEQRIGKSAKLELELARLKQEIKPGSE